MRLSLAFVLALFSLSSLMADNFTLKESNLDDFSKLQKYIQRSPEKGDDIVSTAYGVSDKKSPLINSAVKILKASLNVHIGPKVTFYEYEFEISPRKDQKKLSFTMSAGGRDPVDLDLKSSREFRGLTKSLGKKSNPSALAIYDFKNVSAGEKIKLNLKYKTLNSHSFTQNISIYMPAFSQKFKTQIKIVVDRNWGIFSLNPKFKESGNEFIALLDSKGSDFEDNFWASLKHARWNVAIDGFVYSAKKINNINIFMPRFFGHSGYDVQGFSLTSNVKSSKMIDTPNRISYAFRNANSQDFLINLKAQVETNIQTPSYKSLNPKNFMGKNVSKELIQTARRIVSENKEDPPYIAIGKWVFKRIHYSESFTNYHMSSEKILSITSGVCEHYAQLYNDLMHAYGIPSVFVTGVGYNVFKKAFEYHAWNLVYVDSKWIPVDATWGIFSGKMPVSHIFFYVGYQPLIMYQTYDVAIRDTYTEVSRKIKFVASK